MKRLLLLFVIMMFQLNCRLVFAESNKMEEGYKGIPWGCAYDKFKEMANYDGNLEDIMADSMGSWYDAIEVAIGHPNGSEDYMPELKFATVKDKNKTIYPQSGIEIPAWATDNKTYYLFHDDKLCMVFFTVEEESYSKIKNTFNNKCDFIGVKNRDLSQGYGQEPKHIKYYEYQKAKAKIYIMEQADNYLSQLYIGVLYSSDHYRKIINDEIKRNIANIKQSEQKENNKTVNGDMQKIE